MKMIFHKKLLEIMFRITFVFFALFIVSVSSSLANPKELDRATAAQIIRHRGLPPVEFKVPIGDDVNLRMLIYSTSSVNAHYGSQLNASYGCLTRLGYLNASINPQSPLRNYRIVLTPKASSVGSAKQENYLGYNEIFVFRVADRVLYKVTGIKKKDSNNATVLFEYRWNNFTDIFSCFVKGFSNPPQSASAEFGLYDDGWRVEKTSLDDVGPM